MSAGFNEIGKKVMCLRAEMEEKGMGVGEIIRDTETSRNKGEKLYH